MDKAMKSMWDNWKGMFFKWEGATADYLETVLRSPLVLGPSGKMLSVMMRGKAAGNKAQRNFWGSLGLPTKHDQERALHTLNQLQSRLIDLEEQIEDLREAQTAMQSGVISSDEAQA